jgi:hypothetical protein
MAEDTDSIVFLGSNPNNAFSSSQVVTYSEDAYSSGKGYWNFVTVLLIVVTCR